MSRPPTRIAIGLMSGTSMDGVDAALVRTDGRGEFACLATNFVPYPPPLKRRLRRILGSEPPFAESLAAELTDVHIKAAARLLQRQRAEVAGFPGHTVSHLPSEHRTHQLGDCRRLAAALDIDVVGDFRSKDMSVGGQGAPLTPLFHQQLFAASPLPLAVVNLGGVANVTWLADGEPPRAADVGPGMALIDDCAAAFGKPFDEDGELGGRGKINETELATWLADDWFNLPPPKSLDRQAFAAKCGLGGKLEGKLEGKPEDRLATLTAFTAAAVVRGIRLFSPQPKGIIPEEVILCGGGRKNRTLSRLIGEYLGAADIIVDIDEKGFDGDFLEAQAFAWLAVRHLNRDPFSLPTTTGCRRPSGGGVLYRSP